jgi:hypothetical protein
MLFELRDTSVDLSPQSWHFVLIVHPHEAAVQKLGVIVDALLGVSAVIFDISATKLALVSFDRTSLAAYLRATDAFAARGTPLFVAIATKSTSACETLSLREIWLGVILFVRSRGHSEWRVREYDTEVIFLDASYENPWFYILQSTCDLPCGDNAFCFLLMVRHASSIIKNSP